ncbi:Tc toxin subunit A [Pseudomonas chlororaphis]|uniref:Tc toxin subunit A n=1 Tax=Pseudomonas chlororaphis TaxID=587753 RepID=UPI002367BA29|nr:Tc toxin subunit A [Pseudomonas chlororaphis]WDG77607.1 Tc toxin subunit A [Pseudomonas chlororaphis]WDG83156.1 Tc toxin subunit A [Pseudomonas chlororaphis]
MTLTSPLITRIEDMHQLEKQTLTTLGYASVFDVARVPRERFIRKHRAQLGRRAEKIYDLAIGFAHQVSHQFRRNPMSRAINSALRGPFSRSGPDFANQFLDAKTGWKNKAPNGSPEANDGPVAYLAQIYHLALQQEKDGTDINPLAKRRPDLGQLMVDDAAINKVLPQIQLVNEVLSSAIQSTKKLSGTGDVNELLATTRYPNTLPYHYGHQQIQAAQDVIGTTLQEATLAQSIDLPQNFWGGNGSLSEDTAASLTRLQIMASQLSPEQQRIIVEPAYFGHHHLFLSDIYDVNDGTKEWASPDVASSLPYDELNRGGFILPVQVGVPEYDKRPSELRDGGGGGEDSIIQLELTNASNTSETATVVLRGRHYTYYYYPINDAPGISGNPYPHKLLLSYHKDDNPSVDLSKAWVGQFEFIFIDEYTKAKHGLTISLCLSENNSLGYTPSQVKFYQSNYGDNSLSSDRFAAMEVLTGRTGLTVPEVEQLLCATAGGNQAFTAVISDHFAVPNALCRDYTTAPPFLYGARFIHAGMPNACTITKDSAGSLTLHNLTDDKMDRINRMVRLQRWLGLPFEDVDLLVTSAMEAEGDANRVLLMNDNTLRTLGVFQHYQSTYELSAKQFAAWLDVLTPFAITPEAPFLDQVFNNSGAFDTPFMVDNQDFVYTLTTGDDSARVKKISTALGLNHRQFLLLADQIARQQGNISLGTLNCNIYVISAFYRLASLARTLSMSIEDFCTQLEQMDVGTGAVWKQLAGRPMITPPQKGTPLTNDFLSLLQALSAIAKWQQQHQVSAMTAQLLASSTEKMLPITGAYGSTSSAEVKHLSIGWKDLTYDQKTGDLSLVQQISLQIAQIADGVWQFLYPLPEGFSLNGSLSWSGDGFADVNPDFGPNSEELVKVPAQGWDYPDRNKIYVMNIPLKGTFKDLSALNKVSSEITVSTEGEPAKTYLQFSQGTVLGNQILAAQGTADQLIFIQQVWQHLPSTLVDSALLAHSGAPLVDKSNKAIDWLTLLSNAQLIDTDSRGLVTDLDIGATVKTVVATVDLDDATQAITTLTNALTQAQQTQQGVAVSLLAKTLNISQSFPSLLLRWTGQTIYQWLQSTWALKDKVLAPADLPTAYLNDLRDLVRRALLCQQFSLSPALVQALLAHPEHFGMSAETVKTVSPWALYTLSRYSDLLVQVGGNGTEDDVLAYLQAVNATSLMSDRDAAHTLAQLLGWDPEEVAAAGAVLGGTAKTLPQLDVLLRLQQTQQQTGLGVSQQQQAFAISRDSAYDTWQSLGQASVVGATHIKGAH